MESTKNKLQYNEIIESNPYFAPEISSFLFATNSFRNTSVPLMRQCFLPAVSIFQVVQHFRAYNFHVRELKLIDYFSACRFYRMIGKLRCLIE